MASITIRRLDDSVKAKLRLRAARNGRSMEEEAREILKAGVRSDTKPEVKTEPEVNFAQALRRHIEPLGGVELVPLPREPIRKPPNFE